MWPLTRFVVADRSMSPTLEPGDRLLVLTWPRPAVGDVVVARDPEAPGRYLVKRVAAIAAGRYVLRGDNAGLSRDSRWFGPVARERLVGRVAWRYLPAERRGPVLRRGVG